MHVFLLSSEVNDEDGWIYQVRFCQNNRFTGVLLMIEVVQLNGKILNQEITWFGL